MSAFIDYIMANYIWFLGGAIIILLAIIGSYADKTNFGQIKTSEPKKAKENSVKTKADNSTKNKSKKTNKNDQTQQLSDNEAIKNTNEKTDFDKKFDELDQEIDEFLPKKDIIDDDLLSDIEDLSLDKTQKMKLTDIPDLDDLQLPKIKNLKSVDEDIWKL